MNHSVLKPFAQTARRELRKQIELRLDYVLRTDSVELRQRAGQVKALRDALTLEGRDILVERVAYTWFNRLAALRFMDANGYHPFGARVVTAATEQETLPEVLQQARAGVLDADLRAQLDTADMFDGVLSGTIPTASKEGTAYRMLLVAACHYYHQLMPFLFEKLGDATELLLPEDLLTEQSVAYSFRTELTDADCRDVEVIGWLYQYYISEKKDAVMARNDAVPTEDIPAVTQLFTPHWIVRYLVENSLGRLWLLNRPGSRLREKMPYYIEGEAETEFLKITKPEEIKLLDPAGGSGHMLTYAYDLLYAIYEEEGYDAPEIPGLILKYNLHGIDICDRAAGLAAFALVMKARGSDSRFFRRFVSPQVIALQDVRFEEGELSAYFKALGFQPSALHSDFNRLLHQFEEAKNFGSLIHPCLSEEQIRQTRTKVTDLQAKIESGELIASATYDKILRVLTQAEALSSQYHVAVANPPYMGAANFNPPLGLFAQNQYPRSQADLFSMFIERCLQLVQRRGYGGLITMHSWMFISSFDELRRGLVTEHSLNSMLHLGPRAFDSIGGEVVQTTAFVLQSQVFTEKTAVFKRLVKGASEAEKQAMFYVGENEFVVSVSSFEGVPGRPFAYWASPSLLKSFQAGSVLKSLGKPRKGLVTLDDRRFTKNWWEVSYGNFGVGYENRNAANNSGKKWFPINKGGGFRKWSGFAEQVINWANDGRELKSFIISRYGGGSYTKEIRSEEYYFRPAITWGKINTASPSFRFSPTGFIMGDAGPCIFIDSDLHPILGLLNSKVSHAIIELLSPTVNAGSGDISKIPIIFSKNKSEHAQIVTTAIDLARDDWDNFETSWDFHHLPLLKSGLKRATLEESWQAWEVQSKAAITYMQELETENNRLYIAAYGLDKELQPEVPENQITLARADVRKDVASFLSYAVGCMMGRYSLDQPGLILADAGSAVADYSAKIPSPTFAPDADSILPVLDGEWFGDDVVSRIRDFLRITFGDETLAENVTFVEESLGRDLRKYFTREFYKDHLRTYKKRPIYWMVSSPDGSFQALIYLHRYTRDTVNTLLNDYVREFLHKLESRQQELTSVTLNESARPAERTKATKELGKIEKMLKEIRAWERDVVLPLAQQRIELDLDDGVKMNYQKFPGLLVPIPGLEKKEAE